MRPDLQFACGVLPDRYWKRVRRTSTCWLWTGSTAEGYGRYWQNGRQLGAHVAMYEAAHGHIDDGLLVCHTCDVRNCVNPAHLFAGTYADNYYDSRRKGRARAAKGSDHGMAKLTDDDVRAIRSARAIGERQIDIARKFGIHFNAVYLICARKRWAHVE